MQGEPYKGTAQATERLLDHLAPHIELSKRKIKDLIERGKCTVNGRIERFASRSLEAGDAVELDPLYTKSAHDSSVLYEDEAICAVDKAPGICSQTFAPNLVHRLDKPTSGVLLLGKTDTAKRNLQEQFRKREIKKYYLAIVDGVTKNQGSIDAPMQRKGTGSILSLKGSAALTEWRALSSGAQCTLLACFPKTGRTHQIRLHLSSISHPILGDHVYGKHFQCRYRPDRLMLHAYQLSFTHPIKGTPIAIKAQMPLDFQKAIEHLQLSCDF